MTEEVIYPSLTKAYESAVDNALDDSIGMPLLLTGLPGTGKTSSVYRVAKKYGVDVEKFDSSMDYTDNEVKKYLNYLFTTVHEEKTIILLDDLEHNIIPKWLEDLITGAPRRQKRRNFRLIATSNEYWKMKQEVRDSFNIVKSDTRMGVHAREVNKLKLPLNKLTLDTWKAQSRDLRILQQLLKDPQTEIYDRTGEYTKVLDFFKNPKEHVPKNMYIKNWLLANALNESDDAVFDKFGFQRFETIGIVALADRYQDERILHAIHKTDISYFKKLIAPSYRR